MGVIVKMYIHSLVRPLKIGKIIYLISFITRKKAALSWSVVAKISPNSLILPFMSLEVYFDIW